MSAILPGAEPRLIRDDAELIASIRDSQSSEQIVHTSLATDERVIARVTDGIYRQPGSALRELISNAYDADARRVVINTDAPRFNRIVVEDDGHGMTPEVLANLILHIGGSVKRHEKGSSLGVTSKADPTLSPEGRKLIGKIGIGLFSVSQLTHSFQIITKVKNDPFRTIATVAMRQYADEQSVENSEGSEVYESGRVNVWREPAVDVETHGTTIVLTGVRRQARDTLRSSDIWSAIEQNEAALNSEDKQEIDPPKFHIGRIDSSDSTLRSYQGKIESVPWDKGDSPAEAFRKLVDAVWKQVDENNPNPQLERLFDYYLRMVWQLSLAVPLPYVQEHLFDLDTSDLADTFLLSNVPKGSAVPVEIAPGKSLRESLDLKDPQESPIPFEVFFDGLQLLRPIKFKGLPTTDHALKQPIIFVGKCREEFQKVATELSGGPLDFEAYLFWTPKVAPTEHQGSLIRIHGSSGTLFDPTFMRYQISELTRLRQITCEIFVHRGLDSALNIDRESFNNAHPHAVYISKWLHGALRQLASAQKRLASEARNALRDSSRSHTFSAIQQVAADVWAIEVDDLASSPPGIEISEDGSKATDNADTYVYKRSDVLPARRSGVAGRASNRDVIVEEKVKAIAQVLASFGLLEKLSKRQQDRLMKAVYEILDAPEA